MCSLTFYFAFFMTLGSLVDMWRWRALNHSKGWKSRPKRPKMAKLLYTFRNICSVNCVLIVLIIASKGHLAHIWRWRAFKMPPSGPNIISMFHCRNSHQLMLLLELATRWQHIFPFTRQPEHIFWNAPIGGSTCHLGLSGNQWLIFFAERPLEIKFLS